MPHYIRIPVANIHLNPDVNSGLDSQSIYSEEVSPLDTEGKWTLIQTDDGLKGWVDSSALIERAPLGKTYTLGSLANHIYRVDDTSPHLPLITLPFMSKIECAGDYHEGRWLKAKLIDGTPCYVQQGDLLKEKNPNIIELGKKFLGLPYTWGGKSSFGFDCSGLVQTLFRFKGIVLPRNSYQQAEDPRFITVSEEELQPGDLIFFGKKVFHVGLVIENQQFLHATVARLSTQTTIHSLKEVFDTLEHRLCRRLIKN